MDIVVLKFGGSSLSDNIKLNIVAEKIKKFYNEDKKIIVVVSAQGKTTDNLIKDALSLSSVPNERELDALLSTGEQVTIAKLSILLNRLGMKSISLTGWQAGIYTNNTNQDAIIENIDISRINKELNNGKIVIVAGFQGINENLDITTLGRGGSDTTAVAIASKIKASRCYIFSDVDGVYTTDPRKTKVAKKIDSISYKEMLNIANEGAKVLHNRCVEIGEKFNIPIIAQSTFNDNIGTTISDKIEEECVKNIVKNDDLLNIHIKEERKYTLERLNEIYSTLIENEIDIKNLVNNSVNTLDILFTISKNKLNKLDSILEKKYSELIVNYMEITKISIIGNGITSKKDVLSKTMEIIKRNKLHIINIETSETKITMFFRNIVSDKVLEELHISLIK